MREFTFTSTYLRCGETRSLREALTQSCEQGGMKALTEPPAEPFHHAPALLNNRWKIEILVGEGGWNFLQCTPWNLLCQPPENSRQSRFAALTQKLGASGFIWCNHDNYPLEYGNVLVETDGRANLVASGSWARWVEGDEESGEGRDEALDFYGQPFTRSGHEIAPYSALLQRLLQESQDIWRSPQAGAGDVDDCGGEDDDEIAQRYVIKRLLGLSPYKVMDEGPTSWPADRRHTLWFSWPAADRPEPPGPMPVPKPDVRYPAGEAVARGDAVLIGHGLHAKPGRVHNFLYSHRDDGPGRAVRAVCVEHGESGLMAYFVETPPGIAWDAARLVGRNATDYPEAEKTGLRALQSLAEAGDPPAQLTWGVRLFSGKGVEKNPQQAKYWLTEAARQNNGDAHVVLGEIAKRAGDHPTAARHYLQAAELGEALGQFRAGLACQLGRGVKRSLQQAVNHYEQAMQQGVMAAHYNCFHLRSLASADPPYTEDFDLKADGLRPLADTGDVVAQWYLGLCLEHGRNGASRDIAQAVHYYRLGAAQGFGPCLCNLADKLERGDGVEQDLNEARRLYSQAAEMGVNAASFSLGRMYRDGRGVAKDLEKAVEWLKKAIEQGFGDEAQQALNALPNSPWQQARRLAQRVAACEADPAGQATPPHRDEAYEAASEISDLDGEEAEALRFTLYRYAAARDHDEALHQPAFMYQRGIHVERDMDQAMHLYLRSARLDNYYSQERLAELYESGGEGIARDPEQARHWWQQAAQHKIGWRAQYKLGLRDSPEPSMSELGMRVADADGNDITEQWERQMKSGQGLAAPSDKEKPWWRFW